MKHNNIKPLNTRITISVLSQIFSQIMAGVLGIAILKIMTNDLGAAEYGTYATILAFISTFALLTDLGVTSLTIREIAKHPDRAESIISHNLGMRIALSLIIIPLVTALGFIFYPQASFDLRIGILFMSIYLLFDVIWAISAAYFDAKVRSEISAKTVILQQVLFLLFVVVISALGYKLFGYIAAYITSIAIGSFILLVRVRKEVNVRPKADLAVWRGIISASITLGLISIISSLYLRADSVMLSVIEGPSAVGLYAIAYLLVNAFSAVPAYIMRAVTPSMATATIPELQKIVRNAFHYMTVFSFILVVGCYLVRQDVVVVVSSKEFIAAAGPFAILSFATVFSYFSRVSSFASVAIDKHHKFVLLTFGSLVLNILLNLVMIPRYGIVGAAWSTVITEFLVLIFGYRIFHSKTNITYDLSVLIRPGFAAITSFIIGLSLKHLFYTSNPLLNCVIIGIGITVPYFILLYVTKGLPAEMQRLINIPLFKLIKHVKPKDSVD